MDKINNIEMTIHKNKIIKEVSNLDVAEVINIKTKIPVYEILNDSKQILKQINNNLKNNIIGQDKVLEEIMKTVKRIKLGFKDDNLPYSYLFAGSSGVGKTKLATLLGENMVGIDNIIRLDMSEYIEASSISKIIGAPPGYVGYKDNKNILEEVKNKPACLLILDEIEKAHSDIQNLFFQILDNGKIKDSKGKLIRFDNTIIVMTSNIGFNTNNIGFNSINENIITKLKEHFSIPFINRIDSILVFDKLNKTNINKIIKIKLDELKNKYKKKNINIKYNKEIINEISELSNYNEFGARKIDKIIKDKIESIIIENIINDNLNIDISSIKENTII